MGSLYPPMNCCLTDGLPQSCEEGRGVMAKVRGLSAYFGITHGVPMWALGLWRRWLCVRNVHAFDEVASSGNGPGVNRLVCDACQLTVNIESIDTTLVDQRCLAALRKDGE